MLFNGFSSLSSADKCAAVLLAATGRPCTGVTFRVGDFVYLKSERAACPYIARLEQLYEASDGRKLACVHWCYRLFESFEGTRLFDQVRSCNLAADSAEGNGSWSSSEVFLGASTDLADEFELEVCVIGKPQVAHYAEIVGGDRSSSSSAATGDARLQAWCERKDHFYYRLCFHPELLSWFDAPPPVVTAVANSPRRVIQSRA
jgi:hypothetical protein|eukprot:COSAG01_NODE_1901_length_8963_cov_106.596458_9_plen_203_part_00